MSRNRLDFSPRGRARVYLFTVLGTLLCIVVAFAYDGYSWGTGEWHLGTRPLNNVIIPVILAMPFFFLLLSKMRELAIAHQELMSLASTDVLTSCLNRRAFTAMVDAYLEKAKHGGVPGEGALMIADIDHFKQINDRFGHDKGDEALRLVAHTMCEAVRAPDLVGRVGGEEFGVFVPGADAVRSTALGERIRLAVQGLDFRPAGRRYPISVSVGGALFGQGASFNDIYQIADRHLYAAKRNGRNRVCIGDADSHCRRSPWSRRLAPPLRSSAKAQRMKTPRPGHGGQAAGLALAAVLAVCPLSARADQITIQGCARRGIEPGCIMIGADGRLFDITAAEPKPQVGTMGRVTGTISNGVSFCMQGIILKPATWEPIPDAVCPAEDEPKAESGN